MREYTYNNMTFREMISSDELGTMVDQIAQQINADYVGRTVQLVVVLRGAAMFATDLMKRLTCDCTVTFVRLHSFDGTGDRSTVKELMAAEQSEIAGRDVVVIEDIIDSGMSMHFFKQRLYDLGARTLKVAALLYKPEALQYPDAKPDYYGRQIGQEFVIGYGFDIDEHARQLNAIYSLVR